MKPEALAQQYKDKFGFRLYTRLQVLAHRYPNVKEPNFISWEGQQLTGADTTAKIRDLLRVIPQSD